jgi:hypothetical protein
MTGTITVTAPSTTPATTPATTPGATGSPTTPISTAPQTPSPSASSDGSEPLLAGASASAVKVASRQHGNAVRGSLAVSKAAAGGRLEVRLQAASAALARAGHPRLVQVGRVVRSPLAAGTVSFKVPLDARGRHALRARRRLAVSVTMVLAPAHGPALTLKRAVTLG